MVCPIVGTWSGCERCSARGTLLFMGDLDPPDLLIYAWLRNALMPAAAEHFGINDQLLSALGCAVPESHLIPYSTSEIAGCELLKAVVPDFVSCVGAECAALIGSERKLEIEGLISLAGAAKAVLSAVS